MPQEVIEEVKKETAKAEVVKPEAEAPKEDPKDEMSQEQMVKEIHSMLKGMMEKNYAPMEEEKKKAESNDDLSKSVKENESLKDELAKTTKALADLKNAENKGFTKAITINKSEDGIVAKSDDGKPKSTLDLIKSIHQNGGNRFGF